METFNKSLKYVPGLAAVHRTPLSGRRLASRYVSPRSKISNEKNGSVLLVAFQPFCAR